MDLTDALKFLATQATEAVKPIEVHRDRTAVTYLINGEEKVVQLPRPPREHEANTVEDIVLLANRFKEAGEAPVIWYDDGSVTLVIDDSEQRVNVSRMDLDESDVFRRIKGLRDSRPTMTQKQFIRLLRVELAGTLPDEVLLNKVRKLKFTNTATSQGTIRRNEESIGREISGSLDTTEPPPDVVTLEFPIYKNRGFMERYSLRCLVETDPLEQTFQLIPVPDGIEQAQWQAMADLEHKLHIELVDGIPVYHGTP